MRKYLLLTLVLWGLEGCTSIVKNNNRTKKILIINLDKEIQKEYSKGGLRVDNIIPIFISEHRGDNDEVSLKGDVLKKAEKIKIGDNDEVAFTGKEYVIRTATLKDGDPIIIKYGKGKEIRLIVRTH